MTNSQLSTPLSREQAYALVDAVMADDSVALTASAHEDEATGEWVFEATCEGEPDLAAFAELASRTLGGSVDFAVEAIDPAIDWVARSLEGLQAVEAAGFYVHGSHDTAPVPAGATEIVIDASQAFGTGHHATTTGCLEAIADVVRRGRVKAPLDLGTGTGILAIAIAKRQHGRVVASDIDPVAVRTAIDNARRNGVGGYVTAVTAAGLNYRVIASRAPYDLIVANILAGPLTALAPAIGRVAAPRASVILAGLLSSQAARVLAAYRAQGMALRRRIVRGEWETLVLVKGRG